MCELNSAYLLQLQDVLRIGIDKLLDETEQMDYSKIDFATILGKTDKKGHWLDVAQYKEDKNEEKTSQSMTTIEDNNMYIFEGVDYRGVTQEADIELFDRLMINNDDVSSKTATVSNQLVIERTPRRQMTEEEKAARTAKMLETKARRKQEMVNNSANIVANLTNCLSCVRKKQNENAQNDVKLNYNSYGHQRTTFPAVCLCQMMKMMKQ